jgi:hypothetical protein
MLLSLYAAICKSMRTIHLSRHVANTDGCNLQSHADYLSPQTLTNTECGTYMFVIPRAAKSLAILCRNFEIDKYGSSSEERIIIIIIIIIPVVLLVRQMDPPPMLLLNKTLWVHHHLVNAAHPFLLLAPPRTVQPVTAPR